jgi:GH15 family glucan-1,4-alpha-glucosidase
MGGRYQPIEHYGIIGNLRTAALVGMDGSLDWLCLPHFDSPSVFAAILDDRKGGRFRIAPAGEDFRRKQFYWPDTPILVTRFLHDDGAGEVEDYMPVGGASTAVVRRVYTWIRDAAFTLYGLLRIGFTEEAASFRDWLKDRWQDAGPHRPLAREVTEWESGPLQLMYGIDGRAVLTEQTLHHLEGYCGSRPVRIGNGAHRQLQLDIYGELMDAVYLHNKYVEPVGYDSWVRLRRLLDWLCDNWGREDEGIWEVRSGRRHFVYSKVMSWVALDRGLRLADKRSFPADRARWLTVRDEIYEEVMAKGWDTRRQAFVQAYGSDALDASSLLMPLVFFLAPNDPRMLSTLDAIRRPVAAGGLAADGLVYRYLPADAPDGLPGREGTFNMCSFWLVEALTRAGRTDPARLDDARLLFEQMLGYANHLGLYAEQTGPSGEALGNFPQAFTHLAMISAAFNLDRALGGR